MIYKSTVTKLDKGYVPPILGNGNMSFQVDYEGAMQYRPKFEVIQHNPSMRIWWAGRRYMHKPGKDLVSFGGFQQQVFFEGMEMTAGNFQQELDVKKAMITTDCSYDSNIKTRSQVFIHHDYNLIAVRKSTDSEENIKFYFHYRLCGVEDLSKAPELMNYSYNINENGIDISYEIFAGLFDYKGIIRVFCEGDSKINVEGNRFSFETVLSKNNSNTFYILFCDNVDDENYLNASETLKTNTLKQGFDGVLKTHIAKWEQYYNEGYAVIENSEINNSYNTAQYHLKCYTTRWSLPVGLSDALWHGKYFAFDEFYMLMALLTSNHMEAAIRIPKFRFDGLDKAVFRASSKRSEAIARYPWETLEDGSEGSPSGFWHDHVFHMACIAIGQYFYYKFSGDTEFLRNIAYPVIKRCALFYLNHMIYKTENGKVIVGKCTDLERLGSSVSNAYMTTCGVIKTFHVLYETANLLMVDHELAGRCKQTAEALKAGLPNNGQKYIPYPGCNEESIGVLSGIYPFDVIEKDNEFQKAAIQSYINGENQVGNMYAVGGGVCSWYRTWKALVHARMRESEKAFEAVCDAVKNAGFFAEMFEINDIHTNTIFRPWFTTAAGMLVHAVNEMLLQSNDEMIYIAPALPVDIKNFSFKLAAYNGMVVEVQVENYCLKKLKVMAGQYHKGIIKLNVPQHIIIDKDILNENSYQINNENQILIDCSDVLT